MSSKYTLSDWQLERQKALDYRDLQEELQTLSRNGAYYAHLNDAKIGPIELTIDARVPGLNFLFMQAPFLLSGWSLLMVIRLLRLRRTGFDKKVGSLPATKLIAVCVANYLASEVKKRIRQGRVYNYDTPTAQSRRRLIEKFPILLNEYVRTGIGYEDIRKIVYVCAGAELFTCDPYVANGVAVFPDMADLNEPRILKSLETPPDISTDFIERIVFDISALGLADFFAEDFKVPEEMEDDHVFLKALATLIERSPVQMKEIVATMEKNFWDLPDTSDWERKNADDDDAEVRQPEQQPQQTPRMQVQVVKKETKDAKRQREHREKQAVIKAAARKETLGVFDTKKPRKPGGGRKAKNAEYEVVVVDTRPEEPPEPPADDGLDPWERDERDRELAEKFGI